MYESEGLVLQSAWTMLAVKGFYTRKRWSALSDRLCLLEPNWAQRSCYRRRLKTESSVQAFGSEVVSLLVFLERFINVHY